MHSGLPSFPWGALGRAKLSYLYSNLLQCFITSSVSVPRSCVRQHTQDVPTKQVLPSKFNNYLEDDEDLLEAPEDDLEDFVLLLGGGDIDDLRGPLANSVSEKLKIKN